MDVAKANSVLCGIEAVQKQRCSRLGSWQSGVGARVGRGDVSPARAPSDLPCRRRAQVQGDKVTQLREERGAEDRSRGRPESLRCRGARARLCAGRGGGVRRLKSTEFGSAEPGLSSADAFSMTRQPRSPTRQAWLQLPFALSCNMCRYTKRQLFDTGETGQDIRKPWMPNLTAPTELFRQDVNHGVALQCGLEFKSRPGADRWMGILMQPCLPLLAA